MTQHGFFVDLSRCIGCNSCTVSCKQWQDIAPGPAKPMRVYQWETGSFPEVNLHMLPVMCHHCRTPVCKDACPNGAIYKEEKYGAVLIDPDKCQGTRKCWQACPYGTPQYEGDEPGLKMLKCDMCIDRLEEGLKPICVLSCSMRALEFGPLEGLIKKYGDLKRLDAREGFGPCRVGCPAGVNTEEYITLISEGKFEEALLRFHEVTPFAGVLGRVCARPCESDCQRGYIDQPVAICSLKHFMADEGMRRGREKKSLIPITKEDKVAVVGSGPAGLSCAYDLVRKGYFVTVFEAAPQSGGMLRYGIPEYRLPRQVLDEEISSIEELGVEIRRNSPVRELDDLFKQGFNAVFLATGAWVSQRLGLPGEEAKGVIFALDFLKRVNSGEMVKLGNRVVVIGGGSVAIDTARVALRLGVKEVHLVCLESRDLACKDRMLAQDLEIEEAEEEGIVVYPCLGISEILTEEGRVIGLETILCTSVLDGEGRFAPKFAEGVGGPTIKGDTVIVAIGQRPDMDAFAGVEKAPSGGVKVNELTLETNLKGVFAGADVVTGPANVISAIADGKEAALSIDRYLQKMELREGTVLTHKSASRKALRKSFQPPVLPVEERKGFAEVRLTYDRDTAIEQASRCWHCGSTVPSVVFKPVDPQVQVIPWDPIRALELWQKRQPWEGEPLPDIFAEIGDVIQAPRDIVGRNKLVLKAKDSKELLYYTTDNE